MILPKGDRFMVVIKILRSVNVMTKPRPLSPHLQIYRLPLPALMSISHRLSGVILSTGTLLVAVWLMMLAAGESSFDLAQSVVGHLLGQLVLFGYSVALFYHACNGVRHLFWDAVIGVNIPAIYASGRFAIALAVVLTGLFWAFIYS
tara:strand:- start:221 stop:661 length:441 start_codon:yes stop_codon:yes gene_type:complete